MTFKSDGVFGDLLFLRAYNNLNVETKRRPAAVCKLLGISVRTLQTWLSGKQCPPNAAVIALWYESGDGLQVIDFDAHRQINTYKSLSDALKRSNDKLQADKSRLLLEICELKRAQPGARRFAANDAVA